MNKERTKDLEGVYTDTDMLGFASSTNDTLDLPNIFEKIFKYFFLFSIIVNHLIST